MHATRLGLTEAEYLLAQSSTRWAILSNALLYPVWGITVHSVDARLHDPVAPRLVISALSVLAATLGWRHARVRDALMFARPVAFVVVAHQLWLVGHNRLHPLYFAILYMMVPLMAMGFLSIRMLRAFAVFTVCTMAALCVAHAEVPALARFGYLLGTMLVCGLSYMLVTQKHEASAALRQSEVVVRAQAAALSQARDEALFAARAKGEALANMSHEIRTPLNGVLGMASVLLETPLDAQQREYAETMVSSGENLLRLLNDILDAAKIEAGKLTLEAVAFSPRTCAEEVAMLLGEQAARKRVELLCRVDDDVPEKLVGDPGRLRQVLINLLGNAVKFTDAGWTMVHLSWRPLPVGGRLRCTVQDTGVGLSNDAQDRLFGRYSQADASTTRRYGGTGLGLAISRSLVELMGGTIGLRSKAGEGSTFYFEVTLPVAAPAAPATPLTGRRLGLAAAPGVAGDLLADVCTSLGAACERVAPGAAPGPCDAVLVDAGGDGLAAGAALRAVGYGGPMVLVVAPRPGLLARALEAGFTGLCLKPVRRDAVTAALHGRGEVIAAASASIEPLALGGRVLVADDNRVNQRVVVAMLRKLGCAAADIDVVDNGRLAVEALRSQPYALVVMDCEMPEMDGLEATRALRRLAGDAARVPVLGLTGRAMPEELAACIEAGMNASLSKPVLVAELRAAILAIAQSR